MAYVARRHEFTQGQLPLFMTAEEVGRLHSADFDMRPMSDVPDRLRSAYAHRAETLKGRGITMLETPVDRMGESVAEHGIKDPAKVVHLPTGYTALYDGHHRAIVAMEKGMLLPVQHYTDSAEAVRDIRAGR
jgi:ParB-like chromosome segregation protein Spo0J